MGKRGGDIMRASTLSASAPSSCGGKPQGDLRVGVVATLEEGQPLNVVPVQMGQEDAPFEGPPVEQRRDPSEPGARVEQERGHGRARRRRAERERDA